MKSSFVFSFTIFFSILAFASEEPQVKGLLKDVRMTTDSEEKNQEKAIAGELLISKAEDSAIKALEKILVKRKGTVEESGLQLRLAELYIRKAKTGRFFDLYRSTLQAGKDEAVKSNPTIMSSAKPFLLKAVGILSTIEKRDPQFSEMPTVLFNIAFASQAIDDQPRAQESYSKIINKFPSSSYVPDSYLSLGEMAYNRGEFQKSVDFFDKLKNFINSKAYPYGMYKAAWAAYNLKRNDEAIQRLMLIVKNNDNALNEQNRHNLRREALRDLVLFTAETMNADDLNPFFKKICNDEEYAEMMILAAKLYASHSRHKDLIVMMNAFTGSTTSKPLQKAEALNFIVEAHENLKQRKEVIATLQRYPDICAKDLSEDRQCYKHFRHAATEISSKWWEIWEKNKTHKEFSELTEKALEVVLSDDQNRAEDAKIRLSYADLLFQQEKFERASDQYSKVSRYEKLEPNLRQEAAYSSLISIDKLMATESLHKDSKTLSSKQIDRYTTQLDLTKYYVANFSDQKYFEEVLFKKGFLEYQLKYFEESLKTLQLSLQKSKKQELRQQAQDLTLDILNIDKKYVEIKREIQSFLKEKNSLNRTEQLKTWLEEAEFADLNERTKDTESKITQLESFISEFPQSKLARKAKLLLIPLYFEKKEDLKAAEIIYAMKDSTDLTDKEKLLKLASESFLLGGSHEKTYELLKAVDISAGCEYLGLLKEKARAKGCYLGIVDSPIKGFKEKSLKFLFTQLPADDKDLLRISKQVENQGIEPWATEIQVNKARVLLRDQNYTAAFDLARKVMNKEIPQSTKAKARLIQAQVLESELRAQSVKTRADRLAAVLALKTEKLDKAHTAYFSTSKMTDDSDILREAFSGIQRCYNDYISSIEQMPVPQGISDEENAALKTELAKLIEPMKQKRNENQVRLKDLGGPSLIAIDLQEEWTQRIDYSNLKFSSPKTQFESSVRSNVLKLLSHGQLELADLVLSRAEKVFDPSSGSANKSLQWIYELMILQKASVNDLDKVSEIFDKKFFEKNSKDEIEIARALSLSQKGKYGEFLKIFSNFSKEFIYNYRLEGQHINSARLSGDKKLATQLIESYSTLAAKNKHAERLLKLKMSREQLQADVAGKDTGDKTKSN